MPQSLWLHTVILIEMEVASLAERGARGTQHFLWIPR